jgi:hypothetical protein
MECLMIEFDRKIVPPELDQLESHVQSQLGGRVRQFRLHWDQGGLVLRGCSLTYYAKQLAQQAVMTASDLPIRANEIEVL